MAQHRTVMYGKGMAKHCQASQRQGGADHGKGIAAKSAALAKARRGFATLGNETRRRGRVRRCKGMAVSCVEREGTAQKCNGAAMRSFVSRRNSYA